MTSAASVSIQQWPLVTCWWGVLCASTVPLHILGCTLNSAQLLLCSSSFRAEMNVWQQFYISASEFMVCYVTWIQALGQLNHGWTIGGCLLPCLQSGLSLFLSFKESSEHEYNEMYGDYWMNYAERSGRGLFWGIVHRICLKELNKRKQTVSWIFGVPAEDRTGYLSNRRRDVTAWVNLISWFVSHYNWKKMTIFYVNIWRTVEDLRKLKRYHDITCFISRLISV